jgi:hypothetical protein
VASLVREMHKGGEASLAGSKEKKKKKRGLVAERDRERESELKGVRDGTSG